MNIEIVITNIKVGFLNNKLKNKTFNSREILYNISGKKSSKLQNLFFFILMVFFTLLISLIWTKFIGNPKLRLSPFIYFKTFHQRIFAAIIFAPVIEELINRLPLKFRSIYFTISLTLFTFYVSSKLIGVSEFTLHYSLVITILSFFIFLKLFKIRIVRASVYLFWKRNYTFIFYFMAFFFAFLHVFKYNASFVEILSKSYIIILPRFIQGIILGFVRLKINTFASMLLHSINNSIPFIVIFVF